MHRQQVVVLNLPNPCSDHQNDLPARNGGDNPEPVIGKKAMKHNTSHHHHHHHHQSNHVAAI